MVGNYEAQMPADIALGFNAGMLYKSKVKVCKGGNTERCSCNMQAKEGVLFHWYVCDLLHGTILLKCCTLACCTI